MASLLLTVAAELPNPGIITLMGMGMVFTCLILIYLIMLVMNRFLGPKNNAQETAAPSFETGEEEAGDMGMPGVEELQGLSTQDAPHQQVIAAIIIALHKHRKLRAGTASVATPEGGMNPWKLAARIHGRWRQ